MPQPTVGAMAFMQCIGPCIRCGGVFAFNPERVPSVRVHGEREPLCEGCVRTLNELRARHGLPRIEPLPGAYDAEEVP